MVYNVKCLCQVMCLSADGSKDRTDGAEDCVAAEKEIR